MCRFGEPCSCLLKGIAIGVDLGVRASAQLWYGRGFRAGTRLGVEVGATVGFVAGYGAGASDALSSSPAEPLRNLAFERSLASAVSRPTTLSECLLTSPVEPSRTITWGTVAPRKRSLDALIANCGDGVCFCGRCLL